MRLIDYELLPKHKLQKYNVNVKVDLFEYAEELYDELDRVGIIDRIKKVQQLGLIKVSNKYSKTRYDYIMLQLYLHQLIKNNINKQLRFSYNNDINAKEFSNYFSYNDNKPATVADVLQLLTIVYNVGHFYNTFTASQAVTMMSSSDKRFYSMILNASNSGRYKEVAKKILDENNYHRLHILNSILVLEKCDQTKLSVSLGIEILYSYLNENELSDGNKLRYVYSIFRNVRDLAYMAYDLQIADIPLSIDICNEQSICLILKEMLSEYNNNESIMNLKQSITKLLDDTVYYKSSNQICYYRISRKMMRSLSKDLGCSNLEYYNDLFLKEESALNCSYPQRKDYLQEQILKLTFSSEEYDVFSTLLLDLERINNTRVGYYDRYSGEKTILVAIKKYCDYKTSRLAAFKTMKCVINALRKKANIQSTDMRFLISVKFFLYYLFEERPLAILPILDKEKCVICTRGNIARIKEIDYMLLHSIGNENQNHEAQFMKRRLYCDKKRDTSIMIPASIVVYKKDESNKKLCEFDGMIIYPMRNAYQIVFLEAKNTSEKPSKGKNCLEEKIRYFPIDFSSEDIIIDRFDAYFEISV